MSSFTLSIDTDMASLSARYGEDRPSLKTMEENRRKSVACLLRTVALMLAQGRDVENIRDWNGSLVGHYTLNQD